MTTKGIPDNDQVAGNLHTNQSFSQKTGEVWRNTAEGIEDLRILSKEISTATAKIEQLMKALTTVFRSMEDRKLLSDLVTALNKMDSNDKEPSSQPKATQKADTKEEKSTKQEGSKKLELPVSKDGDSLFDIINSPSFLGIVDKVLEHKKRPRL